jgi:Tol biopolymer transport system component/predicted Ser/Thr protein kinase
MIGRTISHYKIIDKLGEGGMGTVYKAEDTRLERLVALKFLPYFAAQDETEKARFIQEAKAAAKLSHANIAQVHEIGEEDGRLYIVMEYVPGGSLRDILDEAKGRSLQLDKVLAWVQQTAEGLAEAHSHGIIHRDIKPDNLMLTEKGQIKIADFGLARLETATRLTASGTTLGTVNYMSPELITGKDVDHRSDLFSLGASFYELLTGQRAFSGQDANSTYYAILNAPVDPIARFRSDLSEDLDNVVSKLLERDPALRYQSASEVVTDIRRILQPAPTSSLLPAVRSSVLRFGRRAWPVLGWVVALGASAYLLFARPTPPIDYATFRYTPFATEAVPEREPAWSPDGRYVAYLQQIDGLYQVVYRGVDEVSSHPLTNMPSGVNAAIRPIWMPDATGIFFVAGDSAGVTESGNVWSQSLAATEPKLVIEGDVWTAALAPDGETFVCWGGDLRLWVTSPPYTERRQYTPLPDELGSPGWAQYFLCFSPNGRQIGFSYYTSGFWVLPWPDGSSRRPRRVMTWGWGPGDVKPPTFDWLDDRRVVLASRYQPGTWVLDIRTSRLSVFEPPVHFSASPDVSPDGSRIVWNWVESTTDILAIPTDGSEPWFLLQTRRNEHSPSWHPSGERFAYVTDRSGSDEIWMRDLVTGRDERIVWAGQFPEDDRLLRFLPRAQLSPDGRYIAYIAETDKSGLRTWISKVDGGPPTQTFPDSLTGSQYTVSWFPDSEYLLGGLGLRTVRRGVPESMSEQFGELAYATPSPDGDWIAGYDWSVSRDELVLLSRDGRQRRTVPSPVRSRAVDSFLTWSLDGSSLYLGSSWPGEAGFYVVDIKTGRSRKLGTYTSDFRIGYGNYHNAGSLSPDGRIILTTALSYSSDLWILDGFKH